MVHSLDGVIMDQTTLYHYQATSNGMKYTSSDVYDPIRRVPCV